MSFEELVKKGVLAIGVIILFYGIYTTVERSFGPLPSGWESIFLGGLVIGGLVVFLSVDSKI